MQHARTDITISTPDLNVCGLHLVQQQESRAIARKPRNAVCFCLHTMTLPLLFTFTA